MLDLRWILPNCKAFVYLRFTSQEHFFYWHLNLITFFICKISSIWIPASVVKSINSFIHDKILSHVELSAIVSRFLTFPRTVRIICLRIFLIERRIILTFRKLYLCAFQSAICLQPRAHLFAFYYRVMHTLNWRKAFYGNWKWNVLERPQE